MAYYQVIGDVKVKRLKPSRPITGDTFYDEDTGAYYIFYGEGAGWLRMSREDLMVTDGC